MTGWADTFLKERWGENGNKKKQTGGNRTDLP